MQVASDDDSTRPVKETILAKVCTAFGRRPEALLPNDPSVTLHLERGTKAKTRVSYYDSNAVMVSSIDEISHYANLRYSGGDDHDHDDASSDDVSSSISAVPDATTSDVITRNETWGVSERSAGDEQPEARSRRSSARHDTRLALLRDRVNKLRSSKLDSLRGEIGARVKFHLTATMAPAVKRHIIITCCQVPLFCF